MLTKPVVYTPKFVLAELNSMLDELLKNSNIIYVGELIDERPYSIQRFSEWANVFKENAEISEAMSKIKDILGTRAVVGGLRNKLNPAITKFHLINNYGWRDKQEVENSGETRFIIVQAGKE